MMELIFDVLKEWVLIAILNKNLDVFFVFFLELWLLLRDVFDAKKELQNCGKIQNASVNYFKLIKKNGYKK